MKPRQTGNMPYIPTNAVLPQKSLVLFSSTVFIDIKVHSAHSGQTDCGIQNCTLRRVLEYLPQSTQTPAARRCGAQRKSRHASAPFKSSRKAEELPALQTALWHKYFSNLVHAGTASSPAMATEIPGPEMHTGLNLGREKIAQTGYFA